MAKIYHNSTWENYTPKLAAPILSSAPLCGIDTYKDTLNLATGACTRQIKKVVLTGQEDWSRNTTAVSGISFFVLAITDALANIAPVCTHYVGSDVRIWRELQTNEITVSIISGSTQRMVVNTGAAYTETEEFKTYLQQQYAADTPVTIWYVLAEPTTETIIVPAGLSGTVDGFLTQATTPTPANPVYPTANTVSVFSDTKADKEYTSGEWQ